MKINIVEDKCYEEMEVTVCWDRAERGSDQESGNAGSIFIGETCGHCSLSGVLSGAVYDRFQKMERITA